MFDPHCYELAESFLCEEPEELQTEQNKARIAQRIQDCIEDEIECIKQDLDDAREAAKDEYNENDDPRFGKHRDEWRHEAAEAQRLK